MNITGHQMTGVGAAVLSFGVLFRFGWPPDGQEVQCVMALVIAAFFGATAPDWMEVAVWFLGKRASVIEHRTYTHWLPAWLALLVASWAAYSTGVIQPGYVPLAGFGFAIGGLTHLICDIPNPTGIPVFHPTRRVSLNLWRSGRMDWVMAPALTGVMVWASIVLMM